MLIGGLVLGDQQPLSRLLGRPVPVFLGRISYGTYLWHWPVIVALTTLFDTSPAIIAIFALASAPASPRCRTRCWRCRSASPRC